MVFWWLVQTAADDDVWKPLVISPTPCKRRGTCASKWGTRGTKVESEVKCEAQLECTKQSIYTTTVIPHPRKRRGTCASKWGTWGTKVKSEAQSEAQIDGTNQTTILPRSYPIHQNVEVHVPQSEAHEAQRWKVRHNVRYNLRVQSNRSIPHTFNVT